MSTCCIVPLPLQLPVVVTPNFVTNNNENDITYNNNNNTQIIFFRFVNGKTMTLNVNPKDEISTIKQMLVQKMAVLDASVSTTCRSSNSTSIVSSFMGLLWFASLLVSTTKLRQQDLTFIWSGKPLDDDLTWNDYYCNSSSSSSSSIRTTNTSPTVHVSVQMRGGCFMVSATVLGLIMTAIVGSTCTCGLSLIAVPFLLPLLFILPFFCL